MHVPDPHQPVALDTVPEIILHVQVDGVRACVPYPVEPLVAAAKCPLVLDISIEKDRPDAFELDETVGILEVDTNETKTRVADLGGSEPGQQAALIADRMVVGRVLLPPEFGHRLAYGFAETNTQSHGFVSLAVPAHDLHAAVEFGAEVQQNSGSGTPCAKDTGIGRIQCHLTSAFFQKHAGILDAFCAVPYDPHG
jgi:hypothetical protein